MRRALGGKLKLEFIDGTIPVCVDPFDPSYRAWNRCNMLVHSWILNSVSDSIAQSLAFMENAIDVWLDLKERFSQGDLVRIAELQQEIYALKQETRSVTEFYSSLKLLWEELEIYLPIPNCTCRNRCNCDAMRTARMNHHLLHTIRFLTGLNENFAVVKSQVLLMDPLPSLTKVFSLVLQHERQGGFTPNDDSLISTNFVKTKGNSSSSGRQCTYFGRDNHTVQNCFKKHGLPPHLRNKSSVNAAIDTTRNFAFSNRKISVAVATDLETDILSVRVKKHSVAKSVAMRCRRFIAGSLFSGAGGGVVVRVSSPSSSSGHYPLVFGLAAASFCRWVGVLIQIWWCFVLLGEDVVFLPAEVVVLARFWRLGVVLVLVAEVMNGCGGDVLVWEMRWMVNAECEWIHYVTRVSDHFQTW
ncbi:hypothetical protein QL285_020018 [Trifolium repens]|nr:hypothetical protein QL285_020018 [Trifolium repens]